MKNPPVKRKEFVKYVFVPNLIKLGYQDIKIVQEDLVDAQGCYQAEQSKIRIKEGLEGREQLNTVLHEILHAIVYAYGLKKDFKTDEEEEKIVNALGNGLTEVLVRNKELVTFIEKSV